MVVEGIVQIFLSQLLLDCCILFKQWPEWNLFSPAFGCVWLDKIIGCFTTHTTVDQFEQDPAAVDQAQSLIHVLLHCFREDIQVSDDLAKTMQHIVNQSSSIRQDNSFCRRMRNVTFMSESDIFVGGNHVAAADPGQAADIFGTNWVALMRHS